MDRLERLGLTRRVLAVFASIAALFSMAIFLAHYHPASTLVSYPIIAVFGLPPILLIIFFSVLASTLSQALVDLFFIPVAVAYWMLLALAIDRACRIICRQAGRLPIRRLHARTRS